MYSMEPLRLAPTQVQLIAVKRTENNHENESFLILTISMFLIFIMNSKGRENGSILFFLLLSDADIEWGGGNVAQMCKKLISKRLHGVSVESHFTCKNEKRRIIYMWF